MSLPVPTQTVPASTPPQALPQESSALEKVTWFGIIHLAGSAFGWAVGFYALGAAFFTLPRSNLPPGSSPAQAAAVLAPIFHALTLIVPLSLTVQLVALGLLTAGFRELGKVDREKFSLPSILMILLIVGLIIVGAGAVLLFNGLPSFLAMVPTGPGAVPSAGFNASIASLFLDLAFFAVGGVLSLIGVIGGEILGLWRVGVRYNETVIKVGAIFVIIPLLSIVAPILILVGAHEARGRLRSHL